MNAGLESRLYGLGCGARDARGAQLLREDVALCAMGLGEGCDCDAARVLQRVLADGLDKGVRR